jgi:hypothetical protein
MTVLDRGRAHMSRGLTANYHHGITSGTDAGALKCQSLKSGVTS